MDGHCHSFVSLNFQDEVELETNEELKAILARVSQLERWEYTVYGNVLSQPKRIIVAIGWQDEDEPKGAVQIRSAEFWSPLRYQLTTDVAVINVKILLVWSSFLWDFIELDIIRGPTELMQQQSLTEAIDLLYGRTVPLVSHYPPEELEGVQGGTTPSGDQGETTTLVSFWKYVSHAAREKFIDPQQASLGGATQ